MPKSKPESSLRSDALKIRLTQQESQKFKDYCQQQGITRSRLGRKIVREIINQEPDLLTEEMNEFKHAVRQLAGIARNLNQLTRAVNSGQLPKKLCHDTYWQELKICVKQVRNELDKVIDATEQRWVKH